MAVTLTVSLTWPTSSLTLSPAGVAVTILTSFRTTVLKPDDVTVTVYVPGSRAAREKMPALLVTTDGRAAPVPFFLTTTVTPDMTPPSLSTTTPESGAVALPLCAEAKVLISRSNVSVTGDKSLSRLRFTSGPHWPSIAFSATTTSVVSDSKYCLIKTYSQGTRETAPGGRWLHGGRPAILGAVLNTAWVVAVALTLQMTPPPVPATWTDDQPIARVFQNLGHDLKALPRPQSLAILGAGLAGVGLAHSSDHSISAWAERQGNSLSYTPIGGLVGNEWLQGGAAIATYVIGKVQDSAELTHMGSDLIRAQVLNGVLTTGVKVAVARTRPNGGRLSFPSGHSSATFASATVLDAHYGWKVGLPAYAVAGFIGWTRVRDNQHWLSDVIFGSAIGIASGRVATLGHRRRSWTIAPAVIPGGGALFVIKN